MPRSGGLTIFGSRQIPCIQSAWRGVELPPDSGQTGTGRAAMPITSRFVVRTATGFLAVGFLALFVIVGMTVWLGERSNSFFEDALVVRDTRNAAIGLRDALRTAEGSQRGYLLTGNEIYLAPFDTAKTQARRQLESLTGLQGNDAQAGPMLRRLTTVVDEKIAEMDSTIALKTRNDEAQALAIIRGNRGKALMDEANVFLFGIILASDERLAAGGTEQQRHALMLRWVSIVGALVIVIVVIGVTVTVVRYAREIAQARDDVRAANQGLEERVERRTADLNLARERAEVLLTEVNHRVANSLQLVASLVRLQANAIQDRAAKDALSEAQARIFAIAKIHQSLYGSGDVRWVALDEYLRELLNHLESTMRAEGHTATLRSEIEPIRLRTDASVSLGVVLTEWVTNAFKYAYPGRPGEIRIRLKNLAGGKGELVVEDDGIGRSDASPAKGTGLGTRIVKTMAAAMHADIDHPDRGQGTAARLVFSVAAE